MSLPNYQTFVFGEIRKIGRAWYDANPSADLSDLEQTFEKVGEMAWRRLVDSKPLRQIFEEIGINPADYLGPPVPPVGEEHGFIRARGIEFVDENDRPWPFLGYTIHTWLNTLILDGPEAFNRMLDEPIELGYNTILGHAMHLAPFKTGWPQATRLDPVEHSNFYDKLAEGFDIAAARKIRIANGIFADLQYARPGFGAKQHFLRCCEVMRGRWNVFARKGNEPGVNGWYVGDYTFPDMQGVLTSQGQAGVDTPPDRPFLDFVEYAPTRGWKWLLDSGSGMRQIHMGDTQWGRVDVPLINAEPQFFHDGRTDEVGDDRLNDPKLALALGVATTSNCEGGAFGASHALIGRRLQPRARECASEFMRGARAGFVR